MRCLGLQKQIDNFLLWLVTFCVFRFVVFVKFGGCFSFFSICSCRMVAINNYLGAGFYAADCFQACLLDPFWLCRMWKQMCLNGSMFGFRIFGLNIVYVRFRMFKGSWSVCGDFSSTPLFSAGLALGCFFVSGLTLSFLRGAKRHRKAVKGSFRLRMAKNG